MSKPSRHNHDADTSDLPRLRDIPAVAAYLGVCVRTVKSQMAKGLLVPSKVGRLARFTPRDIEEYLERTKVRQSAARRGKSRPIANVFDQPVEALLACSRK